MKKEKGKIIRVRLPEGEQRERLEGQAEKEKGIRNNEKTPELSS